MKDYKEINKSLQPYGSVQKMQVVNEMIGSSLELQNEAIGDHMISPEDLSKNASLTKATYFAQQCRDSKEMMKSESN